MNEDIRTQNFRFTDPVTSQWIGEFLTKSGRRKKQLKKVVGLVARFPGRTSQELAEASGEDRAMIARRLSESMLLRRGDHRACRFNGNKAVTWWLK